MYTAAILALLAPLASAMTLGSRQAPAITSFEQSPIEFAFPPGRGFAATSATAAPCGGIAVGNRTSYPLTGGDVAFTQRADVHNVNILYSLDANPTKFHSFSTYANSLTSVGSGHYCAPGPNFASMGLTENQDITLLAIYQLDNSTRGYFYQCADIRLVAAPSFTKPEYVCGNYTRTIEVASDGDSLKLSGANMTASSSGNAPNPHTSSNSTSTSSPVGEAAASASASAAAAVSNNGLSAAAGGGIGAAVTVVVLAILAGAAWGMGYLVFGKKKRAVAGDGASESSSVPPMMKSTV